VKQFLKSVNIRGKKYIDTSRVSCF